MSPPDSFTPMDNSSGPPRIQPNTTVSTSGVRIRPKRTSSGLGGDPRGDTGAAALATLSPIHIPDTPVARTPSERLARHSKRRRARSLFRRWLRFSLRHTWVNPLVIVSTILALYLVNPGESNPLHSAIFIPYHIPGTHPPQYGKGKADLAFVAFYTIVFSFTREFLMQLFLRPLAVRFGLRTRARQSRFMEQLYAAIYFSVFGPLGLYVMSQTPVWYFNTTGMLEGFPHKTHTALFKAYYLLQASYWAQQGMVLVLMLEKPRKDFKEFVLHHVVTLSLIWSSYRFHFTYTGIAVYITHDISDFFLASSKVLNYIDAPFTGTYFAFFVGSWIYLRHVINLRILWAVATKFSSVGPFELDWATEQYKCRLSQVIAFTLLGTLQGVNLFWLFLILRIMYRYLFRSQLGDDRSDEEEDEVEEISGASATGVLAGASPDNVEPSDKARRRRGVTNGVSDTEQRTQPLTNGQPVPSPTVLLNGKPVEEEREHEVEFETSR